MSDTFKLFDLDAARREIAYPDGIKVPFKGEEFILPAELPADVFDPFLSEDFGLTTILAAIYAEDGEESLVDRILGVLFERPTLPATTINAVYEAIGNVFGEEQWPRFRALRPSIKDYVRLVRGLLDLYGTSLGEAFASAGSSENAGSTSKPTSPTTTPDSTPALSGADPEPAPASSV